MPSLDHLDGEGLVELPQADIVHLQAGALQKTRDGENRADAHFVGRAAMGGEGADDAERCGDFRMPLPEADRQ